MKKFIAMLFAALPLVPLAARQKFALVIGNGAYKNIMALKNPVNDARDMEAALKGLGFQVETVMNGSMGQMESAAVRLKNRLAAGRNAYGFLFYAGHGVQSGRENYLIPVDAAIQSASFLRQRAVSVQALLDELNEAGNALNVVVLDACRDNPFGWGRGGSRGLQVVTNQPADSIIVYATSAGSAAADGDGRNGLFTGQRLKNLRTPGLEVAEVFRLTGADVSRVSNRSQIPAVYNQFFGTAYLGSRPGTTTVVTPSPAPAPSSMSAADYHNRGVAYEKQNDYDKAWDNYNQAIKIDPNYAYAYYGRGYMYYQKQDYDKAIADYTQAIRLDSNFTLVYNARGNAYYMKGDYARAIVDYEKMLAMDPSHENIKDVKKFLELAKQKRGW
ncbi:MAG: hypothetical protein MdMp014T_1118 [Treponematales bacterium]